MGCVKSRYVPDLRRGDVDRRLHELILMGKELDPSRIFRGLWHGKVVDLLGRVFQNLRVLPTWVTSPLTSTPCGTENGTSCGTSSMLVFCGTSRTTS